MNILSRWYWRRRCFHHNRITNTSWIESRLINSGAGKLFWCNECGKRWTV